MRQKPARFALAACGLLSAFVFAGAFAFDPQSARAITNCDTSSAGISPSEQAAVDAINVARAQEGVPPLAISPTLSRAAAWKSGDSSAGPTGFSHTDSLGRQPSQRAMDCGYPGFAGENIAWGFTSGTAVVAAWMDSSGHRANILNTRYTVIGIGQVGSSWTANFGMVDDSNAPAPTATTPATVRSSTATKTAISTHTATPTPTATPTQPPSAGSAGVSLVLNAGVNIVTYTGQDSPVRAALGPITNAVKGVYEWNQASQRWEKHLLDGPAYVNTFFFMRSGGVYAIELSTSAVWTY